MPHFFFKYLTQKKDEEEEQLTQGLWMCWFGQGKLVRDGQKASPAFKKWRKEILQSQMLSQK